LGSISAVKAGEQKRCNCCDRWSENGTSTSTERLWREQHPYVVAEKGYYPLKGAVLIRGERYMEMRWAYRLRGENG